MAGVSKTEDRKGKMLFPDDIMGIESYYIFVLTENNEIKAEDITSINGKTIGVNKNSLMLTLLEKYVKEHGLTCTIKTFDGHLDCAKALVQGDIDGYVITDNYVVKGVKPIVKIGASSIYFAVSAARKDLLADLNRAQEKILAASPYYRTYLYSKYFNNSILRQALNDDELIFLKNNKNIRIGYLDENNPYSSTSQAGNAEGLIAFLREECSRFTNKQTTLIAFKTYSEMLDAMKMGKVNAIFPMYSDIWLAEQQGAYLSNKIVSAQMVGVYKGEYAPSLVKKVAVPQPIVGQAEYVREHYPDSIIYAYETIKECINALKNEEVSSIIIDGNILQRYFNEYPEDKELHFVYLDKPTAYSFAVSQRDFVLQSILNKVILQIDSAKINGIISRNSYVTERYSLKKVIKYNSLLFLGAISCLLLLLIAIFLIYRRNNIRNQVQLIKANKAKSEFLSRMSHDIRTPMNAIVNLINISLDDIGNKDKLDNDLRKIAISSEFLLGLINDILDMSRIESGKMKLTPSVYQIKEFMTYIDAVIKPLCAQKDILFNFTINGSEGDIITDRVRFNQIFFNIISNSIKYTQPRGVVSFSISTERHDNNIVSCTFVINDNGCGISEDYLKHIFQPFEREDDTEAYTGTGLGLAIVKAIVDAMHGTIVITSTKGTGTSVVVHLDIPLATAEQSLAYQKILDHQPSIDESGENSGIFAGKQVLIAEDHPLNQEIIKRLLSKVGFQPYCVQNGLQCIEEFNKSAVDHYYAILMDIRMPVMDGLTATERIRALARPDAKTIPIIAMTANAFVDDELASKNAGMNEHLSKPIKPELLFNILASFHR